MTRERPPRWLLTATTGLVLIAANAARPHHAAAQDVLVRGREAGVEPPAEILRILAEDTAAFRFRRAWKERAAAVQARRAEIEASLGGNYTPSQLADQGASIAGVMYLPVIPVVYSDRSPRYSRSQYQERLFGSGSGAVPVSRLYSEMSGGVFEIDGSVLPWLQLPRPASYYEPAADDDKYGKIADFLSDALVLADPLIDFGQFDNDGADGVPNSGDDDGFVDVAAFIYPTAAKSCANGATGIWPHRWTYSATQSRAGGAFAPFSTSDPAAGGGVIRVDDYTIQSGIQCDGESLMGTGTISHELGHGLDLPDLYDTDLEDGTDSQGIGFWGLMGTGGHNHQMSPAHMNAWSKDRLGWLTVATITQPGTRVQLGSIQQDGKVVRIDVPGSPEYFLLANRQRLGSDRYLTQAGLLIWHIDPEQIAGGLLSNTVNADAHHKGVDLEEADGRDDLDYSQRQNPGDTGDPFPGSTRSTSFTSTSDPSSHAYNGDSPCTVGVRSIRAGGSVASFFVNPSERQRVLGDANGDLEVDGSDVSEAYWHALGWREGNIQLEDADVDRDGDVDIRDGFLIDAFRSRYRVPVAGIGALELVACAVNAEQIAGPAVPASGLNGVAARVLVANGGRRE